MTAPERIDKLRRRVARLTEDAGEMMLDLYREHERADAAEDEVRRLQVILACRDAEVGELEMRLGKTRTLAPAMN